MRPRLVAALLTAAVFAGTAARWREAGRAAAEGRVGFLDYYALGESLGRRGIMAYPNAPDAPTAFRAPLYPGWVALRSRGEQRPGVPALLRTQAVLGGLTVAGVFAGATALSSPSGGLAAAWLFALHPSAVASAASLDLEFFYSLCLLGVLLSLLRWSSRPSPGAAAASGALLGLSLCARSTLALLALPALALATRARPRRPGLSAALFLGAALVPLLPWVLRNAVQFRSFVPLEKYAAAANLYTASLGWVDTVKGRHELWALARRHEGETFPRAAPVAERYERLLAAARARVRADPAGYALSCLRRLGHALTVFPVLNAAAALGAFLLPPGAAAAALLLPGYFYLAHGALSLEARYLLPLLPALCVAAGAAAELVARRLLRRPPAAPPAFAPALLSAALSLPALVMGAAWLSATAGLAAEVAAYRARPYPHSDEEGYAANPAPGLAPGDARRAAAERENERGVTLYLAGDAAGAERAFRGAIAAAPDWLDPRASLGPALLAQGRRLEALAACGEALSAARRTRRAPGSGETSVELAALDCRAQALEELGRGGEAASARSEAATLRERRALSALHRPDLSR